MYVASEPLALALDGMIQHTHTHNTSRKNRMGEGEDAAATTALRAPVSQESTLAQQLCRRVLNTVHSIDARASIASVSRWEHDNSTLVRIRTKDLHDGSMDGLVSTLRRAWPLARVSLVENMVEGYTQAQILVPSADEQRSLARAQAFENNGARQTRLMAKAVAFAALLSFVALLCTPLAARSTDPADNILHETRQ